MSAKFVHYWIIEVEITCQKTRSTSKLYSLWKYKSRAVNHQNTNRFNLFSDSTTSSHAVNAHTQLNAVSPVTDASQHKSCWQGPFSAQVMDTAWGRESSLSHQHSCAHFLALSCPDSSSPSGVMKCTKAQNQYVFFLSAYVSRLHHLWGRPGLTYVEMIKLLERLTCCLRSSRHLAETQSPVYQRYR